MNDHRSDDSGSGDRGDLEGLPLEVSPPPELERRVVGALHSRGLLGARGRHSEGPGVRLRVAVGLAAAAAVLVAAGFVAGRLSAPGIALPDDGSRSPTPYALLLYEGGTYRSPVGAEAAERYSEYRRWVAGLRERDQLVAGEELGPEGWVVEPEAVPGTLEPWSPRATDGPVGGFFVILADDPAEAVAVAGTLPHVRHGGSVVVRPVVVADSRPE